MRTVVPWEPKGPESQQGTFCKSQSALGTRTGGERLLAEGKSCSFRKVSTELQGEDPEQGGGGRGGQSGSWSLQGLSGKLSTLADQ